LPEILGGSVFFSLVFGLMASVAGGLAIVFFGQTAFRDVPPVYLYFSLLLVPFNLALELFLPVVLGAQKIGDYNRLSLSQTGIFLILAVMAAAIFSGNVFWFIAAQIASFAVAAAIAFSFVFKVAGNKIAMPSAGYLKDAFSYGMKNYLGGIIIFVHYRIDSVLINYFINPLAVGFYFAATRIAEGVWLVSQSASTVLFPKIAAELNEARLKQLTPLVCRNVLLITGLASAVLFILARPIIDILYSREFLPAARPFQILLIGAFFVAGWKVMANDLAARGKPMVNTWIVAAATAVNILLNVIMIPRFGIAGAAWASAISYFMMFFATVFVYGRIAKVAVVDVLLVKRSDLRFYRDFIFNFGNKIIKRK
jgi:O-antigen/teichoic acid export membrane protein